jgi:acyl-[acyl-carrier-protein]-phospholipid O-acyltransferase/long-chain-fatty-acid--[acyl-carrier-protein] ligase
MQNNGSERLVDGMSDKSLLRDRAFWGLAITQFLGAFNDNIFKQIILLLSVPVIVAGAVEVAGQTPEGDVQGWATAIFSLPFVLLSGLAGFLSDRYRKRDVIVMSKAAEIVIMLLGMVAFIYYGSWGMAGTWTVLFLMATQSTFFGPGKYGILPELFHSKDLPKANGLILMSTFLAIIFGTVIAGVLFDLLLETDGQGRPSAKPLWIASCACIGIAILGTWTSTWIRSSPPAQPVSKLTAADWAVSPSVTKMLIADRPLLSALLVSCVFWMISGIAVPVVNSLGITQLLVNKSSTSLLVGGIAIGIMVGSIVSAVVFKNVQPRGQVTIGLWGMFLALTILGFWKGNGVHLLGYTGSFIGLIVVGIFAAIYAVPLQVFMQERPPAELKGRMIGTMNQANFIGILLSGILYQLFQWISVQLGWPISSVFWMLALMVLPLAIFYRLGSSHCEATETSS